MKKISVFCIISKSHSKFLKFYFKFNNTYIICWKIRSENRKKRSDNIGNIREKVNVIIKNNEICPKFFLMNIANCD